MSRRRGERGETERYEWCWKGEGEVGWCSRKPERRGEVIAILSSLPVAPGSRNDDASIFETFGGAIVQLLHVAFEPGRWGWTETAFGADDAKSRGKG